MENSDELCAACSTVNFYSLFTGPRYFPGEGYENKLTIPLGTLAEVNANTRCPFCRLVHHGLHLENLKYPLPGEIDEHRISSRIRVTLFPIRADYREVMRYVDRKTSDMVATKLELRLYPLEGLSKNQEKLVSDYSRMENGIQLLSPESVDPARPLLNGFQVTTTSNNLEFLEKWMNACLKSHTLRSESGTCCRPHFQNVTFGRGIRFIDVKRRTIIEKNPEEIDYAALSYVWGRDNTEDATTEGQYVEGKHAMLSPFFQLPPKIPKVVEDAIFVCEKISIPYLWVDRYCIDQEDPVRKKSEIEGMGYRYMYAKIILIAGAYGRSVADSGVGLFPAQESRDLGALQRVETVQGRKYITALPGIDNQMNASRWISRGWTFQEGQLANRCAFFGDYDISFMCGSGHWRESLHNDVYAHDVEMPGIKTDCEGLHILSCSSWLRGNSWKFEDYNSLLMSYTDRDLSFESDRLNAITGCFNVITEKHGVAFINGHPATDFHYALLWTGEYDRPRNGFPSWSWPGWYCLQQMHIVFPLESGTCSLEENENGDLHIAEPVNPEIELQGLIISLTERPGRTNKCSQRFANIELPAHKNKKILSITAEMAHFSLEILPAADEPPEISNPRLDRAEVPRTFNSTVTPACETAWASDAEYRTPFNRLRLRDDHNNIHTHYYPRWYDHWPPFKLCLPITLRGESLKWLLRDGIDLIMILGLKLLEGDESLQPFDLVFCLGIDRTKDVAKRFGMFCLPREMWEQARPKTETVVIG